MSEEERDNIVVLVDEDGNEFNFEVLDIIEKDNLRYAVGLAADEAEDEDGAVLIMRIVPQNDEEDMLEPIEDEDELNAVFEMFKERMQDDFEFID